MALDLPDPKTVPVLAELPLDIAEALDAWIDRQPDPKPGRPDAVAYALRDWLIGLGLLPFHEDPEMAN